MIILAIVRLILFGLVMSTYVLVVLIVSIFVGDKTKASTHLRRPTIKIFLLLLGVRIHKSGVSPMGTVLFIGNHISYLDPFILVHHILAWPVAKFEVASWPLVGYACSVSGVLFVRRRHAGSLRATRSAIAETLKRGDSVVVYPEGTTTDGKMTLPFRRGIFDMAVELGIPVVPVTMAYRQPEASFVREHSFLPHFLKLFSQWRIEAHIHFNDKLLGEDGLLLMKQTKDIIDSKLKELNEAM